MKPLPQCAGSAAEAKDIVRALSEGRVRITQRAVAEPVGTRSTASSSCGPVRKVGDGVEPVPTRATRDLTKHDRLKLDMDAALARRYALGVAFDAQDVIEAMEGWETVHPWPEDMKELRRQEAACKPLMERHAEVCSTLERLAALVGQLVDLLPGDRNEGG